MSRHKSVALRAGTVLLGLLVLLGCSASAAPAQPASSPSEISPTWTPVLTPDGHDGYITDLCFDGSYVILAYDSSGVYGGYDRPVSIAYGGRC